MLPRKNRRPQHRTPDVGPTRHKAFADKVATPRHLSELHCVSPQIRAIRAREWVRRLFHRIHRCDDERDRRVAWYVQYLWATLSDTPAPLAESPHPNPATTYTRQFSVAPI